jgi:hypothetical protein
MIDAIHENSRLLVPYSVIADRGSFCSKPTLLAHFVNHFMTSSVLFLENEQLANDSFSSKQERTASKKELQGLGIGVKLVRL